MAVHSQIVLVLGYTGLSCSSCHGYFRLEVMLGDTLVDKIALIARSALATSRLRLIFDLIPLFLVLFIGILLENIIKPFCRLEKGHFIVLLEHNWGHQPLLTVFIIETLCLISLNFELVSVFDGPL